MRAKTYTASTRWHTLLCAATILKETLENPSSLNRRESPRSPRRLRGRGTREERVKNCFGQVEETFRPSQVVFRGPHDPDTLIIDGF